MSASLLDWRVVVEEANRRRRAEGLTQRDLAALAGVSAPTVGSFERGDTRLRLDKVFDILGALGLVAAGAAAGGQESFVQAAARRWNELVAPLAEGDPSRLPFGSITYDYELIGDTEQLTLKNLLATLREADQGETGWPPFWIASRDRIRPYNQDGTVECWQGVPEPERSKDPSQADFWRVSPTGRAFLRRGLDEDGHNVLAPGSIFDLTLPVWRTAEVLLHGRRLARLWPGSVDKIAFRVRYTGLAGRELASWAKPIRRHLAPGQWRARTDDVSSSATLSIDALENTLEPALSELLAPVYARFNGFTIAPELVADELAELLLAGDRKRGQRG